MENIEFSVILAQLINFWILFFIFKKFIAKPLLLKLEKRRELLYKLEHAESEYAIILEKANSEKLEVLKIARENAQKLLRDMEDIAKSRGQEIIEKAEMRAKGIIESGNREIEKERILMFANMKDKILDLTMRLNEKILAADKWKNKEFMSRELDTLMG